MFPNYESKNEPVKLYKPGSSDKKNLLNEYYKMTNEIERAENPRNRLKIFFVYFITMMSSR